MRSSLDAARRRGPFTRLLLLLGPGLVSGASDDDPSGITTYAQAGALLGFSTLWTALITFPMMCGVQFIAAKIGIVSGAGLARVLREHYPRWLLYIVIFTLAIANTINAGVDLGAIATALNLVTPVPVTIALALATCVIVVLQIFGSYRVITTTFKWLTLVLFAYIAAALLANPPWSEVLIATVRPTIRFNHEFLTMLVAILGTTITPYLFFWQADQEVEEEVAMGRHRRTDRIGASAGELDHAKWDVLLGMALSNVVMYFIILAAATVSRDQGALRIQTAMDAAETLGPVAGTAATTLWALAIAGTGLLTVPILTASVAFACAEAFEWRVGLHEPFGRAKPFYITILVSTAIGMAINFLGINTIDALVWAAVINGFLAPPLLVVLMLVGNNKAVLGDRVNGRFANTLGWTTTAIMFAAALAMMFTFES